MARKTHPNKEIEAALQYAEAHGWKVVPGGGHCWGKLRCPINDSDCRNQMFCSNSIWSTPRNAQRHARDIRKWVNGCINSED
ncbi:MAG: hypothetical protein AAGE59_27310 [Cyanobacteria bacterium P01_F01_bin.86]